MCVLPAPCICSASSEGSTSIYVCHSDACSSFSSKVNFLTRHMLRSHHSYIDRHKRFLTSLYKMLDLVFLPALELSLIVFLQL